MSADNSLFKIGLNIHQARRKRELTLGDIARHTGISKGLLSKIENFRTLPSLPVLAAIARSLNLKLENLVEGIGVEAKTAGQFVGVAGRYRLKGKSARFPLRGADRLRTGQYRIRIRCINSLARRKAQTGFDGWPRICFHAERRDHVPGRKRNDQTFRGRCIYFDGHLPHTPRNQTKAPAELLVIYLLKQNNTKGNHEN